MPSGHAESSHTLQLSNKPKAAYHHVIMTTHAHSSRSRSIPASELQNWLVSFESTLTAGLLGLTKSLLSSGFFPAFSGRWRGEPSDLEEAEGGGGEKVSDCVAPLLKWHLL